MVILSTPPSVSLLGSKDAYTLHDNVKRYTLRDNGFLETKNGSFVYERVLGLNVTDKTAPKLKITVSKELTSLKLSAVTANGLKKVDLYKNDQLKAQRDFAENILLSLTEASVLKKVN